MDSSIIQQLNQAINKSKNILIAFKKDYGVDALSSALAFSLFLNKIGKNVSIACDSFSPSEKLSFLPGLNLIKNKLSLSKKFIVSLDVTQTKIGELSYDLGGDKLNIFITPKSGSFSASDVSSSTENFLYDLIIAIGSPKLEALEKIYIDNKEFFGQTPIVDIDCHKENGLFGQINLVDPSFSSLAEIIFKLIGLINFESLDEQTATCLLTGIISKNAFKKTPVEPPTLIAASRLMAKGGQKDEIIKNICRYQPIPVLKISGLAVAQIKNAPDESESPDKSKIIWTLLKKEDLQKFENASEEKMKKTMAELIGEIAWAETIVLLYEKSSDNFLEKLSDDPLDDTNNVHGLIKTKNNLDALALTKSFNPKGSTDLAKFSLRDVDLAKAEKTVLGEIKKNLNDEN